MSSSNTVKAVARSSLWLTTSFGLAKSSQLISQIVLARLLTPEMFGVWGMVLVISALSQLFRDKALAQVLVHRGLKDKTLADSVYSLGITISVVMFGVQSLIGYPMSLFFGEPVVFPLTVCTALVFLIGAGEGAHGAVLSRRMQFREQAIADCCGAIARLGGAIAGAALGLGVWSFAIAEVSKSIVESGLKRWFSRFPFRYSLFPDRDAVRNVRGYISSLIGINLAVYANTNGDNFIVGRLLGAQLLGFYNMAYQLSMLPAYALSQVNRVNFSVIAQRDAAGQQRYIGKMLELCALISAPIYGIGFVVAPWLVPLLYGNDWRPVVPIFQIVLIFAYSRGFMSILGTSLNALDKPQLNAAINWALVPISIPAFLLSAWLGGIQGVAVCVAIIMGIGAAGWFWLATSRVLKYSLVSLVKPAILPTGAAVLGIAGALLIPDRPEEGYFLLKGLQPLLLLAIYGLGISLGSSGRIPQMLMELVKKVLKRDVTETHTV